MANTHDRTDWIEKGSETITEVALCWFLNNQVDRGSAHAVTRKIFKCIVVIADIDPADLLEAHARVTYWGKDQREELWQNNKKFTAILHVARDVVV